MSFSSQLAALGFKTYKAYLVSPHWKAFKASYNLAGLPMTCRACDKRRIQLHHHTYERLGAELLTDVTPLCGFCHQAVHAILKESRKRVEETPWAILRLQGVTRTETVSVIRQHREKRQQRQKDKPRKAGRQRRIAPCIRCGRVRNCRFDGRCKRCRKLLRRQGLLNDPVRPPKHKRPPKNPTLKPEIVSEQRTWLESQITPLMRSFCAPGMISLTEAILLHGKSLNNGWSYKQLACLGVPWPLRKGWKNSLVGKQVAIVKVEEFLSYKDIHIANKERFRDQIKDKLV